VHQGSVGSWYEFATVSGLSLKELTDYEIEVFTKLVIGVSGEITPVNLMLHGQPPVLEGMGENLHLSNIQHLISLYTPG